MVGNYRIVGIILAAGKGTRINSTQVNKVTLSFLGKPLILYAVELFENIADQTIVVVGAFAQSVKQVLREKNVAYAYQKQQLGTAHAAKVGLAKIKHSSSPTLVLIGYGDHMMFYKPQSVINLINRHIQTSSQISFFSTKYHDPDHLAWGRIERDNHGRVLDIIEQKDATEKQRKIKEVNPGFYCFDLNFIKKYLPLIKQSPISGEYYLPELIKLAVKDKLKINVEMVRFREVGIGINRMEELLESQAIYKKMRG